MNLIDTHNDAADSAAADEHLASRPVARRQILQWAGGLVAGGLFSPAWASAPSGAERALSFNNLHTGERLRCTYWAEGGYLVDALSGIDHVLRDHRTDEVHPIDPQLLDVLFRLQQTVGSRRSFEVISGYRSPVSNAQLRAGSSGVAKKSLHMQGKAIDIRLSDTPLAALRQAALSLKAGGVGYYPASNFVHVDVGRVRHWS